MNQIFTNLQWMELKIDWFSFNFQENEIPKLTKLISIFTKYNISVWSIDENLPLEIIPKQNSLFTVYVVTLQKKYNWDGLQLRVTGSNASHFYQFIQFQSKNPHFKEVISLFSSNSLSRIDIKYIRKDKLLDPNFLDFAAICQEKIKEKNSNIATPKYAINSSSKKIVISNGERGRRNNKFIRVYKKQEKEISFELELKNFSKEISNAFFEFQFQKFEELCVETFITRIHEVLPLHSVYLDWFVEKTRIQYTSSMISNSESSLFFNYLEGTMISKTHAEKLSWLRFFQFINFLQIKKNDPASEIHQETLMDQKYSIVKFRLQEFMDYLNIEKDNHYQKQKILQFFDRFTLRTLVGNSFQFSEANLLDQEFYSAHVVFPVFKIFKVKDRVGSGSAWTIQIAVSESVFNFTYPHIFFDPIIFSKSKYEIDLAVVMIHAYAVRSVEKKLNVNEFVKSYNGSYETQIHIRKLVFESLIKMLHNNQIEALFYLQYSNGIISKVTDLKENDILKISSITFYEKIKV